MRQVYRVGPYPVHYPQPPSCARPALPYVTIVTMTITLRDLEGTYQDNCHGCFKFLSEIREFPARSRYGHGDLCSECGQREAFEGDFIGERLAKHLAEINPR
jgi:hypothetical protein